MITLTSVLHVLEYECSRITFSLGKISARGSDYQTIARCIRNKHIQVVRADAYGRGEAAYNWHYNCLEFNPQAKGMTVVHECTHAQHDWHKRSMSPADDEASARIAEWMYVLLTDPAAKLIADTYDERALQIVVRTCGLDRSACMSAVRASAFVIARELLRNRAPTRETLLTLRNSIQRDPDYRKHFADLPSAGGARTSIADYDGVIRRPIPADYLRKLRGTVLNP